MDKLKIEKSIAWMIQWVPQGSPPSSIIRPGELAGFSTYFDEAPKHWKPFYLGISGTQRFEAADWLRKQAEKLGLDQYIIETKIGLSRNFTERTQGPGKNSKPTDEYELTKPVVELRKALAIAWSMAVMNTVEFTEDDRVNLLTAATSDDINAFLPISAHLFSKTIENMQAVFEKSRAILYPAIPLMSNEWPGKPLKLIAFRREAVIEATPTWRNFKEVEFAN